MTLPEVVTAGIFLRLVLSGLLEIMHLGVCRSPCVFSYSWRLWLSCLSTVPALKGFQVDSGRGPCLDCELDPGRGRGVRESADGCFAPTSMLLHLPLPSSLYKSQLHIYIM